MNIEILKSIIIEGQELLQAVTPLPRALNLEENARYVFVGIRQAGKSFMLYIRALELIRQGHDLREMLFVNFDDERLTGFTVNDFDDILKAYAAMFEHRPILFLDEIQNIDGWEHFARRLANQQYMVYITGSNAKMLSRDIASTLGGRYIEKYVAPYSFREYLHSKGITVTPEWMYGKLRGEVERHLSDYFFWGGFPELNLFTTKRQWLNELYEKIILGDIIQRNSIKNEAALRLTVKRLAENIKTPTSYNRLSGMIKATGLSSSPASIANYVSVCKDACMLFALENFSSKFVERNTVKKHYFIDNGLLNIFLTDSETALMENICAVRLYRKSIDDPHCEVCFYNKEVEIDFYLPKQKRAIQCCYSIKDESTLEREVKALVTFHRLNGLRAAEIVTYSEERIIETPTLTIRVIPLAKWLLAD